MGDSSRLVHEDVWAGKECRIVRGAVGGVGCAGRVASLMMPLPVVIRRVYSSALGCVGAKRVWLVCVYCGSGSKTAYSGTETGRRASSSWVRRAG